MIKVFGQTDTSFSSNGDVVQEFNTTVKTLPVLEGLETTEAIIQENPDIFEQLLQQINAVTVKVNGERLIKHL